MDKKNELIKKLIDLFNAQSLAVLATHRDDVIHSSLVAITVAEDLKELVFATSRSTLKYSLLISNSNVAFVVDNRTNSATDFQQAIAVTITGKTSEIIGKEKEQWLVRYLKKHPELKEFATSPASALIKVSVQKYALVEQFKNVTVLNME